MPIPRGIRRILPACFTEVDDAKQKASKANALKRYCELDTLAMVRLLEVVKRELESEVL